MRTALSSTDVECPLACTTSAPVRPALDITPPARNRASSASKTPRASAIRRHTISTVTAGITPNRNAAATARLKAPAISATRLALVGHSPEFMNETRTQQVADCKRVRQR
jgi:hypothetical protein